MEVKSCSGIIFKRMPRQGIRGEKHDKGIDEYSNAFLLTIVNNGAYVYQKLGFLVPYKWDVSYSFVYEE